MHVVDSYADGAGSTEGKVLGRVRFMHAAGENTARAAAGRAAVERIWSPATFLPGPDVRWRAEADDRIVARLTAPPEQPEITLHIAGWWFGTPRCKPFFEATILDAEPVA